MRVACALLLFAGTAAAGVAVRRDGRVIRHAEMKVEGRTLRWGKKLRYRESLRAYLLVEQDDGALVWAPGLRARIAGYRAAARDRQREELGFLAKDAVKAKDSALARRLYDRANAMGLDNKTMAYVRRKLASPAKRAEKPKADKVKQIAAREASVDRLPAVLLAERAKRALANPAEGLQILREALRLDEACASALALLEQRAPTNFPLGNARAWLDWHLEIGRHGFQPGTGDELELKRAQHHWRPDLYGVGSKEVFLITALKDYALVGRCLRNGELVCRALAALFKTDAPVRREAGPLTLFLYMDKKAFKDHAGDYHRIGDPRFLDWWTGDWSERDDISRFYWPHDGDNERRFLFVFRRTIAQHWMHARNPRYSVSQASRAYKHPGYWLEIGLRNLVAQGRFDVDSGTWDLWNPRGRFMDGLQALRRQHPKRLHAWSGVFLMSQNEAARLLDRTVAKVVRNWSLSTWHFSAYHIWRAQAIGAFAYLWHDGAGKHRARLVQAIVDHYRNRPEKLSPKAICGLSSKELGKNAAAFAKRVAEGWTPGDKG